MRAFHDRASAAGELVAAIVAEKHTGLRLAAHAAHMVRATVRAGHAVRPARGFDMRQRLGFVVKDWSGDVDVHGFEPCEALLRQSHC